MRQTASCTPHTLLPCCCSCCSHCCCSSHQWFHLDVPQQSRQVQQLAVEQAQELVEINHRVLVNITSPVCWWWCGSSGSSSSSGSRGGVGKWVSGGCKTRHQRGSRYLTPVTNNLLAHQQQQDQHTSESSQLLGREASSRSSSWTDTPSPLLLKPHNPLNQPTHSMMSCTSCWLSGRPSCCSTADSSARSRLPSPSSSAAANTALRVFYRGCAGGC